MNVKLIKTFIMFFIHILVGKKISWNFSGGFPGGCVVKNLPASTGGVVQSLVEENPLDKEMAIHSSILAWEIPWAEEFGSYSAWGLKRVRHKLATK